jgi:hypothetical protein
MVESLKMGFRCLLLHFVELDYKPFKGLYFQGFSFHPIG